MNRAWTLKQGQAGVYQVASQLLLRGMNVAFPAVDLGADLIVEECIRIQVKTAKLSMRGSYDSGAYWFKLSRMRNVKRRLVSGPRLFSGESEFVVLWGIDQNRFWITPSPLLDNVQCCVVGNTTAPWLKPLDLKEAKEMHDAGWTYEAMAEHFGMSRQSIQRKLEGETQAIHSKAVQVRAYENQWDLIRQAVDEQLEIPTSEEMEVLS